MASLLRASVKGACHATEVRVFETMRAKDGEATTPEDTKVAAAANAYWTNLAKAGDPNGGGQPKWPAYTPLERRDLDFTLAGRVVGPDPWRARLDLIEKAVATAGR